MPPVARPHPRKASQWGAARVDPIIGRVVDAQPDLPDKRDLLYQPRLTSLAPEFDPMEQQQIEQKPWWSRHRVRNQGRDPSCTGHALAALIDHMRARNLAEGPDPLTGQAFHEHYASAHMLYHNARFHDEWLGEDYGGSSCRGALKGFFYNGVCSLKHEKELFDHQKAVTSGISGKPEFRWYMTRELLETARLVQLGAYYRIRPRLSDFHAAISEAGAIFVSATVHSGWTNVDEKYRIPFERYGSGYSASSRGRGRHAFLIVGYDPWGFWIQNSWGKRWGKSGFAHWSYEDWAANVDDAWVLRVAVATLDNKTGAARIQRARGRLIDRRDTRFQGRGLGSPDAPSRLNMLGHLVPLREGLIDELGRYNHDLETLSETFKIIATRSAGKEERAVTPKKSSRVRPARDYRYQHVLIHFLGGHTSEDEIAARVDPLIPIYKENGVYPLYFLWEAELAEEIQALVNRTIGRVIDRTGSDLKERHDLSDRLIEGRLGAVGARLAREYLRSARRTFRVLHPTSDHSVYKSVPAPGLQLVDLMLDTLGPRHSANTLSYHVVAHDVGALLAMSFLEHESYLQSNPPVISSVNLVSPAITMHQFKRVLLPLVNRRGEASANRRSLRSQVSIDSLHLLVLDREVLRDNTFSDGYTKSWPDLWSRTLGVVEERNDHDSPNIELVTDPTRPEASPLFKFLWLPEFADTAQHAIDTSGANARVVMLDSAHSLPRHGQGYRHELLDLHPDVMNMVLEESILGKKPRVPFSF